MNFFVSAIKIPHPLFLGEEIFAVKILLMPFFTRKNIRLELFRPILNLVIEITKNSFYLNKFKLPDQPKMHTF